MEPVDNFWRLAIYHESDCSEPLKILHHESQDTIKQWAIKLNEQAQNCKFEDKYKIIAEIGKGHFSTVYTCENKLTQEIVAVK